MNKERLVNLYIERKLSSQQIADIYNCSPNKINYWINKYNIPKRKISDAVYNRHNPKGNPFTFNSPKNLQSMFLYGLGIGLYWGEGTKSNKSSVRLGNTDPRLIKKFIEFLTEIYRIDTGKLHFGLQIFSDMSPRTALNFWQRHLKARPDQFQKIIVTKARSIGTYRQKTKHGVLTIYFNNKKLRDIICKEVENQ